MAKLYLVPTPIGNLEDITLRAIRILKEVEVILAEDTRKTSILLKHYSISNTLKPYHKFNEHKILENLVNEISADNEYALVTDAGTPGISDPGFLLVRECIKKGVEVECLPGPTAFIPALVNSGFPLDKFCFEGFLPQKKSRQTRLTELADEERTIVLYESPHRIHKTLSQLAAFLGGERHASVSRELTKIHEETKRGTLEELAGFYSADRKVKGEIVIIIGAKNMKKSDGNLVERNQ